MSNSQNKDLRMKIRLEEKELRSIINLYDPLSLGCAPDDEYDNLVHNLISVLHRGGDDLDKQVFILLKGFSDGKSIEEMLIASKEILNWWKRIGTN